MKRSLIISGFGGQGVMLMGQIIGMCAFESEKAVTVAPVYGPEQRGGTASTTVVVADTYVASPVADEPDMVCAMNQPSLEKFLNTIRPGGILFVNSTLVKGPISRDDIEVIAAPVDDLAMEIGSTKVANVIMLGVIIGYTEMVPLDVFEKVVKEKLSKKKEFAELNSKALKKGVEIANSFKQKVTA